MSEKRQINLLGPEGNAFMLLAICEQKATEMGIDWKPIMEQATGCDYNKLVDVLEKHFGEYFEFLPKPE